MPGFLFAILSAASFGVHAPSIRRGALSGTVSQAVYLTVILGVPLFLLAAAVSGQLFQVYAIPLRGYLLLIAAGVFHFIGGRYCAYRAIDAVGATRASPIIAISTPYSVLMAILLLGEHVTLLMGLGILLIMIGPAIIIERTSQAKRSPGVAGGSSSNASGVSVKGPQAAVPTVTIRQAEGYLFGILAGVAFGTSPLLIRSAIMDTNLGILGGLISYSAAALVMVPFLVLQGRLVILRGINSTAMRWFLIATVAIFLAQMFRFVALSLAPVSIVSPLQRTSSMFTLLFSFLVNRRTESFGPRVIAGIILSVAGSVLLAL